MKKEHHEKARKASLFSTLSAQFSTELSAHPTPRGPGAI